MERSRRAVKHGSCAGRSIMQGSPAEQMQSTQSRHACGTSPVLRQFLPVLFLRLRRHKSMGGVRVPRRLSNPGNMEMWSAGVRTETHRTTRFATEDGTMQDSAMQHIDTGLGWSVLGSSGDIVSDRKRCGR
eukprot:gene21899-biopygen23665